ncbi:MAG: GNAT family N-acetyltransferase [Thermoflexales bacterium]|nr:GNAT family N-acetyltransferase [Thermoflexales bacterium]
MIIPVSRTYSGANDLQSMLDLLLAVRPADRITDYPSIVDLRETLALSHVQDNTRLWFGANDQLVGFAFVDQYNNLRFEVDQQAAYPEIESEIVAWGVECIRRAMQERSESWTLDTSCRSDDTGRIALLERHGFLRQEIHSLHMVRSLDEPIPTPQVPVGFSIRHVAGEQEVEALVTLHRAAFGTEHMTVEERLAMMRVPEYDAELDLLAIAPDGRLAAYCTCSISQEENKHSGRNEGYSDPVATHPDFQRRGLAKGLLLTGLHKLKQRGIDTVVLGTSSENTAMQRAAQAVGFHIKSTTLWFAKPVLRDQAAC